MESALVEIVIPLNQKVNAFLVLIQVYFRRVSATSTLNTPPLKGSVAKVLSTVCPSRNSRLRSDRNCRITGSGNCPDGICEELFSTGTDTTPSTHDRSRLSLSSKLPSCVRCAWQSMLLPISRYCVPISLPV